MRFLTRPRLFTAALALAAAGCATSQSNKVAAAEAFGAKESPQTASAAGGARAPVGRVQKPVSPEKWAKQFRRPQDCAIAAKELAVVYGQEPAWEFIRACIQKGDFTLLRTLLDEWSEQLKAKPEAPSLVAQVLGARGGSIRADLRALQERRIPMFDLASALKQPKVFAGRYVLFVARVDDMAVKKGRAEVVLSEMVLGSETADVMAGRRYGTNESLNASVGNTKISGNYSRTSGEVETRVSNTFEPSGEQILVKLREPDPYLSSDRNFLFLTRFEGVRVMDDANEDDPRNTALVSLISYHELLAPN